MANEGTCWTELTKQHWIDENGAEQSFEGSLVGAGSWPEGTYWAEGTYYHYIDESGDERRQEGTLVAAGSNPEGTRWAEGVLLHYIDESGDERTLSSVTIVTIVATVYCAVNGNSSLTILSLSSDGSFALLGTLFDTTNLNEPFDVYVVGNYAYVADDGQFQMTIVDVSDTANPAFKSKLKGAGSPNYLNGARGIWVSGNYAYVAAYDDDSLTIIDITDKDNPALKGSVQDGDLNGAVAVVVSGNYAYVIGKLSQYLVVVDISDPANPFVETSDSGSLTQPERLLKDGSYVYIVGNHGLSIFDVSDPTSPSEVGTLDNANLTSLRGIAKSGNYVFVSDSSGRVGVIDVTDPANPAYSTHLTSEGDAGVAVSATNNIVVTAYQGAFDEVHSIGIATPTSPVALLSHASDVEAVEGLFLVEI